MSGFFTSCWSSPTHMGTSLAFQNYPLFFEGTFISLLTVCFVCFSCGTPRLIFGPTGRFPPLSICLFRHLVPVKSQTTSQQLLLRQSSLLLAKYVFWGIWDLHPLSLSDCPHLLTSLSQCSAGQSASSLGLNYFERVYIFFLFPSYNGNRIYGHFWKILPVLMCFPGGNVEIFRMKLLLLSCKNPYENVLLPSGLPLTFSVSGARVHTKANIPYVKILKGYKSTERTIKWDTFYSPFCINTSSKWPGWADSNTLFSDFAEFCPSPHLPTSLLLPS